MLTASCGEANREVPAGARTGQPDGLSADLAGRTLNTRTPVHRPRVLYLSRTGLLEPLGQSQVLRYLVKLSGAFSFTLVSFERQDDFSDQASVAEMRRTCQANGIRWLPQTYSGRARHIDSLRDVGRMVRIGLSEARNGAFSLIHARSYIPAMAAAILGTITGRPFIFDMRALWPEELITSGRLRRGSLVHTALVRAERLCLRRAAAVVSLTHAAVRYLESECPRIIRDRTIAVIPTCVELGLFVPRRAAGERLVIGCIGTVSSGWFRLDWLAAFFRQAARREPDAEFEVVTRDAPEAVRDALVRSGVPSERITVYASAPTEVPAAIQKQRVNVMFYQGGAVSELGRSPTRMAEVLACGVPVVVNRGVGDVAELVEAKRVGVVVENGSNEAFEAALNALQTLLSDTELARRCRCTAEEVYSLEGGVEAYREIYLQLLGAQDGMQAVP